MSLGPSPSFWPRLLDQMLDFKMLKFDVDEQLPMKHFNPQCCNVFNFTPSDGVAPLRITQGRMGVGAQGQGWRGGGQLLKLFVGRTRLRKTETGRERRDHDLLKERWE